MTARRPGSAQVVRGRVYGRFWLGDVRESIPMPGVRASDPEAVSARCELVADTIARLAAAGRVDRARDFAVQLGAATSQKGLAAIDRTIEAFLKESGPVGEGITVRQFGERWTGGELARMYPDHVRKKATADDDKCLLEQYVYPLIGSTPVRAVELSDGEKVMQAVPHTLSRARRRHVAQAMHRLLALAVYPAKLLRAHPFPRGFLPKLGGEKAKQYLYPDEDAKLMGCVHIPIDYRLFYGMLDREGMRLSEGRLLEWADIDLLRGVVRLDENKTDEPRSWVLDPGVVAALKRWREARPDLLRPFDGIDDHHPAARFRDEHLTLAGVDRPELFESTEARKRIRVHDLRATFVTVSLANGKTETWVQDRTGHKSTLMIARYRRAARTLAELALGPLQPLGDVLVWEYVPPPLGQTSVKRKVAPSGFEPERRKAATDFKSAVGSSDVAPRRESQPETTSGDVPLGSFAGRLTEPTLARGARDLHQIRKDFCAFEVAAEGMDPGEEGST